MISIEQIKITARLCMLKRYKTQKRKNTAAETERPKSKRDKYFISGPSFRSFDQQRASFFGGGGGGVAHEVSRPGIRSSTVATLDP